MQPLGARCMRVLLRFRMETHSLPIVQPARDFVPGLVSPEKSTMQLFMWQHDIVGVAHYIRDCFDVLGSLCDAADDASASGSSALAAGWM